MTSAHTVALYRAEISRLWADQSDGAHDLGHLDRVWHNARQIADAFCGADMEVLLAAAYFHDAVNLPKNHPDRTSASRLSAEAAVTYLRGTDFPPEKLSDVAHVIEAHSFSAAITPETPEAEILQDADRLEALGAIGIARMFYVAGATGRLLFDPDDPLAQHRPYDDNCFALDHLEVKLFPITQTMRTAPGRKMAQERADWIRSFRAQLLSELPQNKRGDRLP